jgi:DNA-binding beta-propeller fold protein YncE
MMENLPKMNRIASFLILPMLTLAIVVFSRFADDGESDAPPPSDGVIVVANLRSESLTFIDLLTGAKRELVLPGPPHEMVQIDGRLYVTLGRGGAIAEVDVAAAAILRVLPLEGEPHGIALYGGNIVVTLDKANAAAVIDRATLTELRRYPTGATPHVVAVTSDAILVTDSRANVLRQLVPAVRTTATGGQPEGLAIAGAFAVTADAGGGTVTIASAADLSGARTFEVGELPVRVTPYDAQQVLVSLQGEGEIAVVEAATGKVRRRIDTAARPDGTCIAPGGDYFAAAANAGGQLELFSTGDWKRVTATPLSAGLGACLWLPAR